MMPNSWISRVRRAAPRWAMTALLAVVTFVAVSAPIIAKAGGSMVGSDEGTPPDGRLEGYNAGVQSDAGSSLTYLLFVVLVLITAGVTFMNAKRTHLD